MFSLENVIDNIQTTKKTIAKTVINNEEMAKLVDSYIDSQTEFAKSSAKFANSLGQFVTQESVKLAQDAAKFDYLGYADRVLRTLNQPWTTNATTSTAKSK
jgi:hypothetical protein